MASASAKIPVVLDTDIGTDIDDTWALAMLLRSPELDVKMISTATFNTTYRARIVARLLETAGRTDIPIAVGSHQSDEEHGQAAWVKDYDLARYPGTVHHDGVEALVRLVMAAPAPLTFICIGPLPNIAAALRREPRLAGRCRFVGMHGSVYRGYLGKPEVSAEYNVKKDVPSCQAVFAAPWRDLTITPLDTCGLVRLEGARYRAVRAAGDPLIRAVIENYRVWSTGKDGVTKPEFETRSSILFDTVAVHLAFTTRFLKMKKMGLRVDDAGFTVPDDAAAQVNVAWDWEDQEGYQDFLVDRLLGKA